MSTVELFFQKVTQALDTSTKWEDLNGHEQIIFTQAVNAILQLAYKGNQNA